MGEEGCYKAVLYLGAFEVRDWTWEFDVSEEHSAVGAVDRFLYTMNCYDFCSIIVLSFIHVTVSSSAFRHSDMEVQDGAVRCRCGISGRVRLADLRRSDHWFTLHVQSAFPNSET